MLKCELRIISGARAGHRDVLDKSYIGLGRHPLSDVKFDAEKDLDASTRHAAIVKNGDSYVLKDLGSTNGTYVNGEKLEAERTLHDGDVLKFGVHGPEVSFHIIRDEQEVMMEAVHVKTTPPIKTPPPTFSSVGGSEPPREMPPATNFGGSGDTPGATRPRPLPPGAQDLRSKPKPAPKPAAAAAPSPPTPSKTSVLRAEISHQKSKGRALAIAMVIVVLGALGIVYWQTRVNSGLAQQNDTLSTQIRMLQAAQAKADSEKTAIQAAIRTERDPAQVQVLQTRLASVTQRSAAIQTAQGVDYTAISTANDRAIAVITVRFASDTLKADQGTAFSVSSTGEMITNKHVVVNDAGENASEIAVSFSGSHDVLPARLVRVSPNSDLAIIQLESAGPFPVVAGLSDTPLAEGAPVALIGFPGGWDDYSKPPIAKLVTGAVRRMIADSLYELDAFSGVGASGSPIFDRAGKVIGVEFGGLQGSSGRAIVGLPIARARALLGSH